MQADDGFHQNEGSTGLMEEAALTPPVPPPALLGGWAEAANPSSGRTCCYNGGQRRPLLDASAVATLGVVSMNPPSLSLPDASAGAT